MGNAYIPSIKACFEHHAHSKHQAHLIINACHGPNVALCLYALSTHGQLAAFKSSTAKALVHQFMYIIIVHGHAIEGVQPLTHACLSLQPLNRPPIRNHSNTQVPHAADSKGYVVNVLLTGITP